MAHVNKIPNEEFKKRWVEALRSGKYRQARGFLQTRDGAFCCLGVAEDIAGCNWHTDSNGQPRTAEGCRKIPSEVGSSTKAAGVQLVNLRVCIGGRSDSLDTHNDDGRSFEEIAKAIEEQL